MAKQKNLVKDTVRLGVGSMAGLGAMGAIGNTPGMPANNITGIASAGIGLANIGQMSKNARTLAYERKKKR